MNLCKIANMNQKIIFGSIILSFASFVFLILFPSFDIAISKLFFDAENGFIFSKNPFAIFIFRLIPILTKGFVGLCVLYLICYKVGLFNEIYLRSVLYLLIVLAIGPGLIVNYALKNNHGRARPSQVKEFGGTKDFTVAIYPANNCDTNCSFPSGHASMAIYFTSFGYVASRFKKSQKYASSIYLITLILGLSVGLIRIIMGGHFASDVLAASFIVLSVNYLMQLIRPIS
jgi:lipid A 4'-phosphatase